MTAMTLTTTAVTAALSWSSPEHGVRRAETKTHKFMIAPIVGMGGAHGRGGVNIGYRLTAYRRGYKTPIDTQTFSRVHDAMTTGAALATSLATNLARQVR